MTRTSVEHPCPPRPAKRKRDFFRRIFSFTYPTASRFFEGAHDFKLENLTFQVIHKKVYKVGRKHFSDLELPEKYHHDLVQGGAVLLFLDKTRVAGAEVDSSARDPPPQCHPETRKELRETLDSWRQEDERFATLIWLSGPAGAGKTAVAQTFAERCLAVGQLGAAFFFSRLQERDSPDGVIATIAFQLATRDAGYNHLITRVLSNDPSIIDKTLRVQFQKLIVEPFSRLASEAVAAGTVRKPLVIIIDGVDECNDERAQCQLIQLIRDYVQLTKAGPTSLLWLVCSRPEWHLKRGFGQVHPSRVDFSHEEITCDAAQDIKDVYVILKDGLQRIHEALSCDQMRLEGFQSLLRFIAEGSGSPNSQLDICLLYLESVGEGNKARNPLAPLDLFYQRILARVPPTIFPITKQILAFYILLPSFVRPIHDVHGLDPAGSPFEAVFDVIRFLKIEQEAFHPAFRYLHSVLDIPQIQLCYEKPLRFCHKSLVDFLVDSTRSKDYAVDLNQVRYDITILTLRWHNHFIQFECELECCKRSWNESALVNPPWISNIKSPDDQRSLNRIKGFVRANCWNMFWVLNDSKKAKIQEDLRKFDFCHYFGPPLLSHQ